MASKKNVKLSPSKPTSPKLEIPKNVTVKSVAVDTIYKLEDDNSSGKLALTFAIASYILYMLWSMLSNATWDEDCPTRYFNTLTAMNNPSTFISLWDRPLFVLLFVIPVKIGKIAIPIFMSLYAVISGWFLYKSARKLEMAFAPMIILFLLFQPYYMGVGRNAMTEPLASLLICIGYFLYLDKKWLWFALVGSLIPLARIELSVFLAIWALVMLINNAWKYIPLLGLGLVLWSIGGYILEDNLFYVFDVILDQEGKENRYGHQEGLTYFKRYFYIIGPVVFFYFFIGFLHKLFNKSLDLFVFGQFALGFILYTLLAWKFNAGQSAGFLRNLIPLSPFVALYALHGFKIWIDGVVFKKWTIPLSIIMLVILCLVAAFFKNSLTFHHIISDKLDVFNLPYTVGLVFGSIILLFIRINKPFYQSILVGVVALTLISFTLLSEKPDANMNAERYMINDIAEDMKSLGLFDAPNVVASHGWLYWVVDIDLNSPRIKRTMLKDQLDTYPKGTVIVWENHFSNRLGNNIELSDLTNNQNFIELATYTSTDFSKTGVVFLKRSKNETENALNEYIQKNKNVPSLYYTRATLYRNQGKIPEAKQDLETMLKLAPNVKQFKVKYVEFLIELGEYPKAHDRISELLKEDKEFLGGYSLRGSLYFQQNNYEAALRDFEYVAKKNKKDGGAYYNLGLTLLRLNKTEDACYNFRLAVANNFNGAQQYIDQYCSKSVIK